MFGSIVPRRERAVTAVGLACASLLVAGAMRGSDVSELLRLGAQHPLTVAYAQPRLGQVALEPKLGHDGKYFFLQAHDPFLVHPATHARFLELPIYRSQRMLYPMLAAPGILLGEWGLAWAMLVVNLAAMALGIWATARLAASLGASHWWGLAFVANPGMVFELVVDGSGVVAWSSGVLGLWLLSAGRRTAAVMAFVAACLARETLLLVVLGAAIYLWRQDGWRQVRLVAWPMTAVFGWGAYVRLRLGYPIWAMQSEAVGVPFSGVWDAAAAWPEEALLDPLLGVVVMMVAAAVAYQSVVRPSLISYGAVGFVLTLPFLTGAVWLHGFDITRAVAPLFTSFALATASGGRRLGP